MKLLSAIFAAAVSGNTINRENRPTLEETRVVIKEIAARPTIVEVNAGEQPEVIYLVADFSGIADDVHGPPQDIRLPPEPPIEIYDYELDYERLLPPMPAFPLFGAAYFGVQTCNESSPMLEFCEQANPRLFALRREVEGDASLCTCHDPFTGKVTVWDQECSKSCPSEDGNTCMEKRAADLAMLDDARNGGFYIADFSPTQCEEENEALFKAKNWRWTGDCFCHSPLTGIGMGVIPCDFECPILQNGALSFPVYG